MMARVADCLRSLLQEIKSKEAALSKEKRAHNNDVTALNEKVRSEKRDKVLRGLHGPLLIPCLCFYSTACQCAAVCGHADTGAACQRGWARRRGQSSGTPGMGGGGAIKGCLCKHHDPPPPLFPSLSLHSCRRCSDSSLSLHGRLLSGWPTRATYVDRADAVRRPPPPAPAPTLYHYRPL